MKRRAPHPTSPPPDAAAAPAANGAAADPFAQDIDAVLRDAPEVAPSPDLWTRITADLDAAEQPAAPRRPI